MRRVPSFLPSPVTLLVASTLGAVLALTLPGPAAQADGADLDPAAGAHPVGAALDPTMRALARATQALGATASSVAPSPGVEDRPEATLALRDLFVARRSLDADQGRQADQLLARPTDGASDPNGDGYSTTPTKSCSAHICLHWVRSGTDAPPDDAWAQKTRQVMEQVWRHHIGTLGFRRPATDGSRGGNAKFDVYLKELGNRGLFGYCAPERRVRGERKQASGFCVLDNDFAASQFGRAPIESLRVTAAHEFFHAIQFAYDYTEDPWLLESTATWIEERFADGVNDNRAYLKYGQAARAATSLDLFEPSGLAHYGNWVFWEYLSERFGNDIVRSTIQRTGTGGGLPDDYSTQALRKVLASRGGLPRVYAAFAAGNTQPALSYEEGAAFPGVVPVRTVALSRPAPRSQVGVRVDHLAAKTVRFTPTSLGSRKWRLRLKVAAPAGAGAAPAAAVLVVRDDGSVLRREIALNARGRGHRSVVFSTEAVRSVSVTLANASTRYSCDTGSGYACSGRPLDQRERLQVTATARRR